MRGRINRLIAFCGESILRQNAAHSAEMQRFCGCDGLGRRRDGQASINAHEMREFRDKVVAPALYKLQPIADEAIGGSKGYMVQIARDNGHNSLCYEMRLSFALTIGATFERSLRLWLSLGSAEVRPQIERANRTSLIKHIAEIRGASCSSMVQTAVLAELWELVSTARHGDGPAAKRLRELNPSLWSHQDESTQFLYERIGLRAYSLRIQDADLERYFDATIDFWDRVSRK